MTNFTLPIALQRYPTMLTTHGDPCMRSVSSRCRAVASLERDPEARGVKRRDLVLGGTLGWISLPAQATDLRRDLQAELDTQITQKVVFDVGLCMDNLRFNRTLGEKSFCRELQPLGKLTIGLFGRVVPITVANFVKTVEAGAYDGTIFNKVIPGEYISAGKQGYARNGEVEAPNSLVSNPEVTSSQAFLLTHSRPGTISLALSESLDSTQITLSKDYHPTQFLVTTGPGPAPRLNNGNVVFGRLVDGFDVLAAITDVRTFTPASRIRAFNSLARAIGDERADEARKNWYTPIQPVVIVASSILAETSATNDV